MLDRAAIAALIPHGDTMCLLDGVRGWSVDRIEAIARSHLNPANPLRRRGRLSAICGCEYACQAAALHGALLAGGKPQPAGLLAALHVSRISAARLDDPALGTLTVESVLEAANPGGMIYAFRVTGEKGTRMLEGRGTIVLPRAGAPA